MACRPNRITRWIPTGTVIVSLEFPGIQRIKREEPRPRGPLFVLGKTLLTDIPYGLEYLSRLQIIQISVRAPEMGYAFAPCAPAIGIAGSVQRHHR